MTQGCLKIEFEREREKKTRENFERGLGLGKKMGEKLNWVFKGRRPRENMESKTLLRDAERE